MRTLTSAALLALILLGAAAVFRAAQPSAPRPNVVILLTDDQGTLDANCYGSVDLLTPNIDQLAASGIRFTQASAHTVCCPARAALLTERHPQRGGMRNWTQGDRHGKKPGEVDKTSPSNSPFLRLCSRAYSRARPWGTDSAPKHKSRFPSQS